ncbi:MAG: HAMP domain-containing protein [Planctomycetes bacterium]|nr:HAMP domain-containing protein [Planctomycetota bacterium]
MKIANKINLSFSIVVVILVGIASFTFYTIAKTNLEKAIYAHLSTTAQSRANHIETHLEGVKARLEILTESNLIEDTVKKIIHNGPDSKESLQNLDLILRDFAKAEKEAYELFILNPDGKIIASTDERHIGADESGEAHFLGGKDEVYIRDAHYSESEEPEYSISAPIRDDYTKELLGILVGEIRMTYLNEITTDRTGLGKTGEIYIVNKYGYMITPSRFKEDTFLKQKVDTENCRMSVAKYPQTHTGHGSVDIFQDYRGVMVLGAHEDIPEMQWSLLAEIDEKEALAPLAVMKLIFIIIFCTIPAVIWTVGSLLSRIITAPIHKLHKGTEIIGEGNLDYKVGTDTKDEIGQLARAFDMMTSDLKGSTTSIDNLNKEIAERKQAEDTLRSTYEELENANHGLKEMQSQMVQSEKLASIGQLAAGVAHEMNTPIGFVASNFQTLESYVDKIKKLLGMYGELTNEIDTLGKSELLNKATAIGKSREDMKIDFVLEDIQELFDDSKEGLDRVTDIIQTLRDFSRIDRSGSLEKYDLNEGIKATLIVAQNEIKYDADVKTEFSELPRILCHSDQINQVLLNILVNAVQAINSRQREGMGAITIKTYAADSEVICEISDDGPGIDPDTLSKIFDPFFTTKSAGEGTGLGLSVSYDIIVHKHDGKLLAESTVDKGTKFTIKLPIAVKERNEKKEIKNDGKKNSIVCRR